VLTHVCPTVLMAQLELSGKVRSVGTKAEQAENKKKALALRDPLTAAFRSMMTAAIDRADSA
jgi:hypothetical protein